MGDQAGVVVEELKEKMETEPKMVFVEGKIPETSAEPLTVKKDELSKISDTEPSTLTKEKFTEIIAEDIFPAFMDITSFKLFSHSEKGLGLHHHDVQDIAANFPKVEDLILEMFRKWEEVKKGRSAISHTRKILQIYQDAQDKQSARREQPPTAPPDPTATHSTGNAIIIFNRSDKHLHSYKPSGGSWAQMQIFSGKQFTTTIHRDYIYKISGRDVHQLKYVEPKTKWVQLPELNEDHGESACATGFKDSVYVGGGSVQPESSPCIEEYDISSDEWKYVSNKITARCLVSTKDRIYCIGVNDEKRNIVGPGETGFGAEWNYINPIKNASVVCATVLGDLIYVVCGEEGSEIQCYDIENNSWVKINIVHDWPFEGPVKILTVNENLYIIGKKREGPGPEKFRYSIYSLDTTDRRLNLVEKVNGKEIYVPACLTACIE